jgi:hypothetical protein
VAALFSDKQPITKAAAYKLVLEKFMVLILKEGIAGLTPDFSVLFREFVSALSMAGTWHA